LHHHFAKIGKGGKMGEKETKVELNFTFHLVLLSLKHIYTKANVSDSSITQRYTHTHTLEHTLQRISFQFKTKPNQTKRNEQAQTCKHTRKQVQIHFNLSFSICVQQQQQQGQQQQQQHYHNLKDAFN